MTSVLLVRPLHAGCVLSCKSFAQRKIEQCFHTECEYHAVKQLFFGGVMLTTSAAMADKIIICVSQRPVFANHQSVGLVRVVVAPLSHMRPWHLQMSLELSNRHPKIHLEPTLEQFQLLSQEVKLSILCRKGCTQILRIVLSKRFHVPVFLVANSCRCWRDELRSERFTSEHFAF